MAVMMRLLAVAVLCSIAVVWTGAQTQAGDTLVLRNVTIIDGTGAPARPDMTLVIRDGRISDLFPNGQHEAPAGARFLDVAGRYVAPGLIDAHVHLAGTPRPRALVASLLRATLLGGVTTVRDMGGNGQLLADLIRAAQPPDAESPRIHASAVFAGASAFWFTDKRAAYLSEGHDPGTAPWLVRVDNRTNIRDAIRRAKAWGATGVKLHSYLSGRQVRQIADEARRQRMAVWSRAAVAPALPRDVVDARAITISHAADLVWQGSAGVPAGMASMAEMSRAMTAVPHDAPVITGLLRRMRDRNVMLEPVLYAGVEAASFAGEERPAIDEQVAYASRVTSAARAAGVRIVAGTDAVGGATPNLHAELQLLVTRAGLTPLQAIQAATLNAARAIGLADVGTVAVGQRADLIVLARNPAEDIRNTQTILLVLRDGVVHQRVDPMPPPPLGEPPVVDER